MKKMQLTLAALLFISLAGYSQFKQGTFLVGGNGNFSINFNGDKTKTGSTTTKNDSYNSITVNPQAGYFVIDNLAVGAGLTLTSTRYSYPNSSDHTSVNGISFSPFGRYYYQKFYGQLMLGVGSSKTSGSRNGSTFSNKENTSAWSIAVGYAYFLNDHVSLEPQIGYGANYAKQPGSTTTSIDGGLFIRGGIYVYLFK